ncbi:predicted protein [Uncinocarpus reesii 1704]|uniref:Protein kinase domain-containing protein n=1 Tax=Uncinocarpus reesii (strain UAMH 1704) TaxID=336963 RepID=C4JQ11_UNCRE|nr:uncharacterized protein UREG_03244 [Uncinocarpus reesii 1704]EEP78398.1 predicted protein [Uncinocarpus reesii 1704]
MANIELDDIATDTSAVLRSGRGEGSGTQLAATQLHASPADVDFLSFIYTLWQLNIPVLNPCLLDTQTAISASGTLGRGGQSVVDAVYENQRYSNKYDESSASKVIYKRTVKRTAQGEGDPSHDTAALESFVREVSVLGRLRGHPNVIQLLGVAWEQAEGCEIRPVLVIEYAPFNSLAYFLSEQTATALNFHQKREFCADIASGLSSVHENGIIWGDCKPENILIFKDDSRPGGLRAKVSDFGACEPEVTIESRFRGFSVPWTAPEALTATGFAQLVRSEIYSFGLVVWSIAMDGRQFQKRYWGEAMSKNRRIDDEEVGIEHIQRLKATSSEAAGILNIAVSSTTSYLNCSGTGAHPLASHIEIETFTRVLESTLQHNPNHRTQDMASVAQRLYLLSPKSVTKPISISRFNGELSLEYLLSTYGADSHLKPVASLILEKLINLNSVAENPQSRFQASLCYLVGFGTKVDLGKAAELMKSSAFLDYPKAQGMYATIQAIISLKQECRDHTQENSTTTEQNADLIMFDDLEIENNQETASSPPVQVHTDEEMEWLKDASAAGSWLAAAELHNRSPTDFQIAVSRFRSSLVDFPSAKEECDEFSTLSERSGSLKGNSALHLAALKGSETSLKRLIDIHDTLELVNGIGETPLICATRAGHAGIAAFLLTHGANINHADNRGITASHWLVFMNASELQLLQCRISDALLDAQSISRVDCSEHWGATLQPGTPLDWAVDRRNFDAVDLFLERGANPQIQTLGRPSAINRAAGRHDFQMCDRILRKYPCLSLDIFDSHGESPLSYCFQTDYTLERLLISGTQSEAFLEVLELFARHGTDFTYINAHGENVLYSAIKRGNLEEIEILLSWLEKRQIHLEFIFSATGPNRWSSFRRALYASDKRIFTTIFSQIDIGELNALHVDESPDGLSIFHELAFVPESNAREIGKVIFSGKGMQKTRLRKALRNCRLPAWGGRARMTAFQLAVLCQNFSLADFWVKMGANPLAGLERQRFLGYLISYQKILAAEPSKWLLYMRDDGVPNVLRRFPHPAAIEKSITYLLCSDSVWWSMLRRPGWSVYWHGPEFDRDSEHEPLIAWRPDMFTALTALMRADSSNERSMNRHALQTYGTSGYLDANSLAFSHRVRHTLDFGSFLISYEANSQKHARSGHNLVTALDLAFDMVLHSSYSDQAERIFLAILDKYSGPLHCNFPYFHYSPIGRSWMRNLTRRETLLHRAIRAGKITIVERLLEHGADWNMANTNWQSPLRLANLLFYNLNPDDLANHGSFLQRLGPAVPPNSADIETANTVDNSDGSASVILAILNEHARSSPQHKLWGPIRAIREVHWPWSKYETDDLGIRFIIYYVFVLTLVALILGIPLYVWNSIASTTSVKLLDVLVNLQLVGDCVMLAKRNGSDPRAQCSVENSEAVRAFQDVALPPVASLRNLTTAVVDTFSGCYNGSLPQRLHGNSTCPWPSTIGVPGCDDDTDQGYFDAAEGEFTSQMEYYLKKMVKCKCTWRGKPYREEP